MSHVIQIKSVLVSVVRIFCSKLSMDSNDVCIIYSNKTSMFELMPSLSSQVMIKANVNKCPAGILEFS